MTALLLLVNALVAILMIILILLQRTDPASGGVFGGTGGGNQPIIRKPTAFLSAVFLINCLTLAYLTRGHENANSIMSVPTPAAATVSSTTPALPELPAALGAHAASPTIVSATAK
jgi:protein translocase SecG subunit